MAHSLFTKLVTGTAAVVPLDEFKEKLALKRPLNIKLGVDPTAPDLHLGHAVVLSKLRQFQEAGHNVIFLIGDFTARIGDPTGKSKTRPPLSDEQILFNSNTYFQQVGRILDPEKITIRYNSEWLGKLDSKEFIRLCAQVTLARVIEREDFAQRLAQQQSIGFHELLYPLLQGYDSVALHADVELGGTDQTFNLLMGRYLQEQYNQKPQVTLTVPLLPGLDGVAKMSKSLGNAIGLTEPADQAYGKLMSISDDLMWVYYELLLHQSPEEIKTLQKNVTEEITHPMALKKHLAHDIIARFWSEQEAQHAQESFEHLFQKKDFEYAEDILLSTLITSTSDSSISLIDLLKKLDTALSSSEARRLITAGAVTIDGTKITIITSQIKPEKSMTIKVGKHRFYKIV